MTGKISALLISPAICTKDREQWIPETKNKTMKYILILILFISCKPLPKSEFQLTGGCWLHTENHGPIECNPWLLEFRTKGWYGSIDFNEKEKNDFLKYMGQLDRSGNIYTNKYSLLKMRRSYQLTQKSTGVTFSFTENQRLHIKIVGAQNH